MRRAEHDEPPTRTLWRICDQSRAQVSQSKIRAAMERACSQAPQRLPSRKRLVSRSCASNIRIEFARPIATNVCRRRTRISRTFVSTIRERSTFRASIYADLGIRCRPKIEKPPPIVPCWSRAATADFTWRSSRVSRPRARREPSRAAHSCLLPTSSRPAEDRSAVVPRRIAVASTDLGSPDSHWGATR